MFIHISEILINLMDKYGLSIVHPKNKMGNEEIVDGAATETTAPVETTEAPAEVTNAPEMPEGEIAVGVDMAAAGTSDETVINDAELPQENSAIPTDGTTTDAAVADENADGSGIDADQEENVETTEEAKEHIANVQTQSPTSSSL